MKKKICALFFALLLLISLTVPALARTVGEAPKPINWLSMIGISVLIGLVLAGIIVLVMKSSMKSVRRQSGAAQYTKDERIRLTARHDRFLYREVQKTPRPKQENS